MTTNAKHTPNNESPLIKLILKPLSPLKLI
jgi:hypothetical protein